MEQTKSPMTEQEVKDLMASSKSEQEWNDNCDKVKRAFGDYPDFWFRAILASGLAYKTQQNWLTA